MKRIKLSLEALCASSVSCFPVWAKPDQKKKWIDDHDLFVDTKRGRAFALVDTVSRIYFMDAVTGSLYHFGNCVTSDFLKASDLHRSQYEAEKFLMQVAEREGIGLVEEVTE